MGNGDAKRAARDAPRLLARHSEHGYVEERHRALFAEPEAVSEETQQRLTRDARQRWADEQRRAWGTASRTITQAVATFRSDGHLDREVNDAAKAIERAAERVGKLVERRATAL